MGHEDVFENRPKRVPILPFVAGAIMNAKARYRAKNREKLRARGAVYRAANRERIRLASLSYQRKNAIYYIYYGMLVRCYNPENNGYHNYGGRGIQVCDEWRQSRDAFKNWAIANGWGGFAD